MSRFRQVPEQPKHRQRPGLCFDDLGLVRERGVSDSDRLHQEIVRIVAQQDVTSLYQPIVELRTGHLVGCEVLSRGPVGSPLHSAPALFGAASRAGLLSELDLICRVLGLRRARDAPGDTGLVFLNVEPGNGRDLSMNDELAALVRSVPFQIVVEFTERALTRRSANLLRYADGVHGRGNLVAVDDLGADPHSLALVPLLRPEVCKLDLGVVHGTAPLGIETAVATWQYAQRTGAAVLAEGIETEEHRKRAMALGAVWGQGYLFAPPGPIEAITRRARAGTARWRPRSAAPDPAVAGPAPQRVSRLMLALLSEQMEEQARQLGPHALLLASFEDVASAGPALLDRYAVLAERAALVGIVGVGVGRHPAPGVQGGSLAADDELAGTWSVAVIGPNVGTALTAVAAGPSGSYDVVYTSDPVAAARVAERIARRLAPRVEGDAEVGLTSASTWPALPTTPAAGRRALAVAGSWDEVTGCWNRAAVLLRIETALRADVRSPGGDDGERLEGGGVAVFSVDLDGFRTVNDSRGYGAGDALLRRSADRLRAAVRADDLLGRVGDDEFLVLCRQVPDERAAHRIAGQLRAALAGGEPVAASVGSAWTPAPVVVDVLLARAARDLRREKASRKDPAAARLRILG